MWEGESSTVAAQTFKFVVIVRRVLIIHLHFEQEGYISEKNENRQTATHTE